MAAYMVGWRGKTVIRLDNTGVTQRMEKHSDKGTQWNDDEIQETPIQWIKMKDPDVHAETMAWAGRFTEVQWKWHRGHPELRMTQDEYGQHDWANVRCDKIAEVQYKR